MFKRNYILATIVGQLILCATTFSATYYVSPLGEDSNGGILEGEPFQTVQHAIDQMKAGDTLVLLDGVYRGTLQLKSGITLRAQNPRNAVFTGAEPIEGTNFTLHSGSIYKSKISTAPKQLFYQNKPMTWATWPKVTWADNWVKNKRYMTGDQVGSDRLIHADFSSIKDADLTGAYCYLRDWFSVVRRNIQSFDGTSLTLEKTGSRHGTKRSEFFLAGAVDLIGNSGEWAYRDNTLYFYPPDGKKPNAAELFAQTNDYTINEAEAMSDITIEGVDFFATSVKLSAAGNKNINFRNVHFTYTGGELDFNGNKLKAETHRPVRMSGSNILFDKCLFAHARHSALAFTNAPDFTVQNCVFMENNPYGSFGARALTARANGPFTITRNTFFNVNADAMSISFGGYQGTGNPHISYNNIFNAGVFNPDVSGVYLPNKNMHWTEFHHNWVHNCNGNAVRLDQAGQHFSVHHNVCWASKRGLNLEGFDSFNIYNNTSVLNRNNCFITRNVDDKRKGNGDAIPSYDFSFSPIDDWNVLNNLITSFVDRVGPSEKGPFASSLRKGIIHPDRPKKWDGSIPVTDRGDVQGNLTGFKQNIFKNGALDGLNLIPIDDVVRNGAVQTPELASEGIEDLDSFRGAYDVGETNPWIPGSNWMPYGLPVLKTMAESEAFAKQVRPGSILAEIKITDLPSGHPQEPAKLIYNGRLAVSHDGNIHDEDDWGALAFVWGIVASFGMQEKLVHVDHSDHLVDNTARGEKEMVLSAEGWKHFPGFDSSVVFNAWRDLDGTIANFKKQAEAGSETDMLSFMCAGPMDVPWQCINAVTPSKRKFIRVISHAGWNNKHTWKNPDGSESHTWDDMKRSFEQDGVIFEKIPVQNTHLGPHDSDWSFLNNMPTNTCIPASAWKWMLSREQKHSDVSDCGMTWYCLTGDVSGTDKKFETRFKNPIDPKTRIASELKGRRPNIVVLIPHINRLNYY